MTRTSRPPHARLERGPLPYRDPRMRLPRSTVALLPERERRLLLAGVSCSVYAYYAAQGKRLTLSIYPQGQLPAAPPGIAAELLRPWGQGGASVVLPKWMVKGESKVPWPDDGTYEISVPDTRVCQLYVHLGQPLTPATPARSMLREGGGPAQQLLSLHWGELRGEVAVGVIRSSTYRLLDLALVVLGADTLSVTLTEAGRAEARRLALTEWGAAYLREGEEELACTS